MDASLRRLTPLLLVGLAFVVWADALLGGRLLTARFGSAFHAFAIGILCLYVALGVVERQRLETTFKEVLAVFRQFRDERRRELGGAGDGGGAGGAGGEGVSTARAVHLQREAMQILIGALAGDDPGVRQTALQNLRRITGQDLGEDAAAWRTWLEGSAAAGGGASPAARPGDGGSR